METPDGLHSHFSLEESPFPFRGIGAYCQWQEREQINRSTSWRYLRGVIIAAAENAFRHLDDAWIAHAAAIKHTA